MPTPIFSVPLRVYIEDTDAGGIVYHANYLKYMERARTEWLRALGYGRLQLKESGIMFVVNKMNISYAAPARLDDQLLSTVNIIKLRHVSMLLHQVIYRLNPSVEPHALDAKSTQLCAAEVSIASVDRIHLKPHPFDSIRKSIEAAFQEFNHKLRKKYYLAKS